MPATVPRRLTANPARPARYFPGKATAPESESSDEEEEDEGAAEQQSKAAAPAPKQSQQSKAPAATSFPARPAKAPSLDASKQAALEAEFETESEAGSGSEESGSGSGSEESDSEEESSEDDTTRRRQLIRPTFVKKDARAAVVTLNGSKSNGDYDAQVEADKAVAEEERKKERADELIQAQIERNAAARAAGKKFWDDEEVVDEVDDTDGVDAEAEFTAWKLRELTRVKRDRDLLIAAEKEREEIERRRNLSKEEREAEDAAHIADQKAERDGKGSMGFMQKYFHKGAFFTDDLKDAGLAGRDVMGSRYADDVVNRESLPEYMQIRDMAKLGKKGRTRYKDMRSEDTGNFGMQRRQRRDGDGLDDRFKPDRDRERERTGANAGPVGERRRREDDGDRDGKRPRYD